MFGNSNGTSAKGTLAVNLLLPILGGLIAIDARRRKEALLWMNVRWSELGFIDGHTMIPYSYSLTFGALYRLYNESISSEMKIENS
jgi:hypothetical protein